MDSCSGDKKSLYLFYAQGSMGCKWTHSLYKIDLPDTDDHTEPITVDTNAHFDQIDPVMVIPNDGHFPLLMNCARIASKLYIVGGMRMGPTFHSYPDKYPRDVYVFDLSPSRKPPQLLEAVNEDEEAVDEDDKGGKRNEVDVFLRKYENITMKKDAACVANMRGMIGVKHNSVAFSANGMLYVFGSIPESSMDDDLGFKNLFQRFDPSNKRWTTLKKSPPLKKRQGSIRWIGVNVYKKRQQVVLLGLEYPRYQSSLLRVLFYYNLENCQWERHDLPPGLFHGLSSLTFQEVGDDNDYLYGLSYFGLPLKSKTGYVSVEDEYALECSDGSVPIGNECGLLKMIIPNDITNQYAAFYQRNYRDCSSQALRYLGKGIFCCITTGMIFNPSTIVNDYKYRDTDPYARGVTITMFKEKRKPNCFHVEVLHHQRFAMVTPFINVGEMMGCFVISMDQLQRNLDKRRNKKKVSVATKGSVVAGDVL